MNNQFFNKKSSFSTKNMKTTIKKIENQRNNQFFNKKSSFSTEKHEKTIKNNRKSKKPLVF